MGVRLPPPAPRQAGDRLRSSSLNHAQFRLVASSAVELARGRVPPLPVALLGPGQVHPRLVAEPEHVLERRDRERRARAPGDARSATRPGRRVEAVQARSSARAIATSRASCRCRACRCRRPMLLVVLGQVRVRRVAAERELQDEHAREAELVAQPHDRLGDHAEVLGDERQRRRARAVDGVEERRARARAASGRASAVSVARRAPPSTRRSRGSGRGASGRRARTCGGGARSTSGSRRRASPPSRRAGCPTAGRSPRRGRAARPRRRRCWNRCGCARWSAPSWAT